MKRQVTIDLDDLRSILDEELIMGVTKDRMARHRRLTVLMIEAENTELPALAKYIGHGNDKIGVIKAHRAHYGSCLKDAKYWSEGDFSKYSDHITDQDFLQELAALGCKLQYPSSKTFKGLEEKPSEGWVNIYPNGVLVGIYETKEDADKHHNTNRIRCALMREVRTDNEIP